MNELLDLLNRLPRPLKYLGVVFLLTPMVYVVCRLLGVEKYWWVVVLGILVIVVLVSLFNVAVSSRERSKAKAFEGELRRDAQKGGASKEEVKQALGDLAAKWSEAVIQLKQAGLDVYSLPWYLLIGEPQSGKSTTLKNSGLEFPVGADALSGAGGTRNCDWWFANEAVILDTAGRFTFQEESAPDQAEWSSFLKLLRKYRRYCPINGVLVVIPCTSLLEDSPEEQERKATNIRQKLLHVQRVLEIRFPVFILVTKADRILGFSEFFLKLDPIDQQQLFGWSSTEGTEKPYDPDSFDGIYDQIGNRLYRLRLKFLGDEENPSQADKLYVFPEEFRALKTSLSRYFKTIFQRTRFDEPFAFRGFYFSSGVQQGRPIAQASRDLLDVPGGAGEGVLENLESIFKKSRAFFIRHFYEKKVFPEQGLITRTVAAEAKQRKVLWLVRGIGIVAVLLFLGGMYPAYQSLQGVLKPIRQHVRDAKECTAKASGCSIAESYRIATALQEDREKAKTKKFWFALFLRGTESSDLFTTLGAVQRKVYIDGVVRPLLDDTSARMGVLDWATFTPNYRVFESALHSMLSWKAVQKAAVDADGVPLAKPESLKLSDLIEFERKAAGVKGGDRSADIDGWIAALPASDDQPNKNLEGAVKAEGGLGITVPDPAPALEKFYEFWTVRNLARWDWTLIANLKVYIERYNEMLATPRADPPAYLGSVVRVGRVFRDNFDATTRHLASPRPTETAFPGGTLSEWRKNFETAFEKLSHWKPVAETRIGDAQRRQQVENLDADFRQLQSAQASYAYLLDRTQPKGPTWSKPADALAGVLNSLTSYADLEAFAGSEDGKPLADLASSSDAAENAKKIDEWRQRQEAEAGQIIGKGSALAGSPPELHWDQGRTFVQASAQFAFLWRILPSAGQYFNAVLVEKCQGESCYQPAFARSMITSASAVVAAASRQQAARAIDEPAVVTAMGRVWKPEDIYLRNYIGQMAGHLGSGAGFVFPAGAAGAGSWTAFQREIRSWQPQGGGTGSVAGDPAGRLTDDQFQTFALQNSYLKDVYEEYRRRIERPRALAASSTVPADLLQAATAFRTTVSALSDEPLTAWKQLARGEGGASLKDYHSFSIVRSQEAQRMDHQVAEHGANLMRDAIRPKFATREPAVWNHIQSCCLGKFPLVNDLLLQDLRQRFANGTAYTRSGGVGSGQATYRVDLQTVAMSDLLGSSAAFVELGNLANEFALDPIFAGQAPEFDFTGGGDANQRAILATAGLWERFIYGPPTATGVDQPREHKIEMKLLDLPTGTGTVRMGNRIGIVTVFDRNTIFRPSTDEKTGRIPPPYVWRLGSADTELNIVGKKEGAGGWSGVLELNGGPLKLFYYILAASENRGPNQSRDTWQVRVEIPDAEIPNGRLQGVFELKLDAPLPSVITIR